MPKKRIKALDGSKTLDNLAWAQTTFRERNKTYGTSYIRHGVVMAALYPNGMTLRSPEDFARFGVLNMAVSKMCRYTTNPDKGHADSAHDLIVYGAMLEELT